MSAMNILWCIVEGDSKPFTVTASSLDGKFIVDLQKVVKEEGINAAVLAKDLTLWKVCTLCYI
jgi:hypothetical protein